MRLRDRLVGHEAPTRAWARMRGRAPHALLLLGPPGIGKRLWALAAAQDLLCESPRDDDACGACPGCRAVSDGSHPDLVAASPSNGRFYTVGKEDDEIRPILDRIALKPARGRSKVLLLDRVEGLKRNATDHEAADALLKALEEPPEDTRLLLVASSAGEMIPTVLSRCVRLFFAPLSREQFLKALSRGDSPELDALYRLSRGSPGEALRLQPRLTARAELSSLLGAPPPKAMSLAQRHLIPPKSKDVSAEDRRREAQARLEMLQSLVRDRLPGLPASARAHVDLPAPPPDPEAPRRHRALGAALRAIQANADLSLTLETCAIDLAAPA